jgi:hypothetical protein
MLNIYENAHQIALEVIRLEHWIYTHLSIDDDFFERLGALRNSHFSSANIPTVSITT